MTPRARIAAWSAALFGAAVALVAAVLALLHAGLEPERARVADAILDDRGPLLAFLALVVLIGCVAVARGLHARFVAPLRALAEQAIVVATANRDQRIASQAGGEVAELARAVERLAQAYRDEHGQSEARMAESGARLAEERNQLAALMSELSEGVIVCSGQGRILLYNEQARALFAPAAGAAIAAQSPVGLGRSVFAFLDRDQVMHAMDKIRYGLDRDAPAPVTVFFTPSVGGDLIRVRLAPFLAADRAIAGLVLTCEDVTRALGRETQRRDLLQALATRVRAPAANMRAAAENLTSFPDMAEAERRRFAEIIAAESAALSATIDEALRTYADALQAGVALEDMRLADLLAVARRRLQALEGIEAAQDPADESLWVKVDSYALAQAMAALAERLRDECAVSRVAVRGAARGGFAEVDLAWTGAAPTLDALGHWESLPVQVGSEQTPVPLRHVLERHGGEVWHQSGGPGAESCFRFLIPLGEPAAPRPRRTLAPGSRPEYYDFDLFDIADAARGLLGQRLADLHYTVFDTETTGVEPSAGDRILSIGAVRIVNGRLLKHDAFDQLVDPQRSVPRDSIRIHGIQAAALAGQPTIAQALPAFHRFCEDTVLVAHNAAFDMRFLELAEAESGVRFRQPVLDTLLLSAVAHRHASDHSIEAIAERLGVAVVGRHTALGDALVTAEIFLRLLPLLAEQGITTLGEALAASRETYYVRLQY